MNKADYDEIMKDKPKLCPACKISLDSGKGGACAACMEKIRNFERKHRCILDYGVKGEPGEPGPCSPEGTQGPCSTGTKGAAGQRVSRWREGTAITGTSTTPAVFSGSGITDALVNDVYLNTSTGNVYRCTAGGNAQTAKWVYIGNIKGVKEEERMGGIR